eukprot:1158661-Pelagomonas_calceolata.AAC.2
MSNQNNVDPVSGIISKDSMDSIRALKLSIGLLSSSVCDSTAVFMVSWLLGWGGYGVLGGSGHVQPRERRVLECEIPASMRGWMLQLISLGSVGGLHAQRTLAMVRKVFVGRAQVTVCNVL